MFTPGQVLGDRYQILEMLGKGGIGEVWHAFDLKLRVEVALKALREDLFRDERRLEMLRQEVRAAREVMSPNVCRIFDLQEAEGRELVSMEYIDGATLLEVLQDRGPLELKEAQDIASQFLAGLEAIHQAGLVHRDVKPENIMLTRSGRVVVMDFGLARTEDSGAGTVAGTPAYMSPEQAAGLKVDARADVYSAGVVLAEMVSPEGIKSFESRQSIWEGVRSEPAKVPDSPWAPVVKKAVAKDREHRYNSAHTLIRALEDRTFRVEGAEDVHPYPGLASFTESDAEYFFGREAEIERLWRKLERPHLLGIVGPSGSGKSSFIRAGLIPSAEAGWSFITCTPGNAAFRSLRQELASELAGDVEAMRALVDVDDLDATVSAVSRWRARSDHALLIIDQFEELFTLNPMEVQARFTELLGRLVLEADTFVLLSMRDDFFFLCHQFEALKPLVTDLTLLGPPTGAARRRAIVQPAMKCGYRFEDDELVDEMLAEVEGERGVLPLLAFAMSRLWEKRDRENGLLTRQAYHDIGGVAGALARHAEATIDRIGHEQLPIVRELFRNLVTAEGTRAVREWDELLSIFRDSSDESPEEVLRALIDARLLTSYEVRDEDKAPTRRVEIIHESLLANWPRLVGWQTQDADSARMRDELRQAARAWEERGRHEDRLWTGAAFREYQVWRERYPGGLTETEEAFGSAMTRHANRRRRRRRAAVAAAFAVLLVVMAIMGGLWRRSVNQARRAEAADLISLARVQLGKGFVPVLPYAIASLERADNPEARRLAVEDLWKSPAVFRLPTPSPYLPSLQFSADGRWLATVNPDEHCARLWPSDGGPPTILEGSEFHGEIRISPRGDLVAATIGQEKREIGLWSFPAGRYLRSLTLDDEERTMMFKFSRDGDRLLTGSAVRAQDAYGILVRSWPVAGGEPDIVARVDDAAESLNPLWGMGLSESRLSWVDGRKVHIERLGGERLEMASTTWVEHDSPVTLSVFDEQEHQLVTADVSGAVRLWSLESDPPQLTRALSSSAAWQSLLIFDESGSKLACPLHFWDLSAPPEAEPLQLRGFSGRIGYGLALDPDGNWLAASDGGSESVLLWPVGRPYPRILRGQDTPILSLVFSPDGRWLVTGGFDGSVRVWPVDGTSGERSWDLHPFESTAESAWRLAMAADGSFVVVGTESGLVVVIPLDSGPVRRLAAGLDAGRVSALAVGPDSRFVAAGSKSFVRLWDLESEEVRILDAGDGERTRIVEFTEDGDLMVGSGYTLRRWDLAAAQPEMVEEIDLERSTSVSENVFDVDLGSRRALLREAEFASPWVVDLDTREATRLESHPAAVRCTLHANGELVASSDVRGALRIGPATGGEPYLLLGHEDEINAFAVSPDGRWIASAGDDSTVRLWPMPDFSKPPLHTLPRKELIAKLKTLTNERVVRDEDSPTGWKVTVGPFPGWETVPTW